MTNLGYVPKECIGQQYYAYIILWKGIVKKSWKSKVKNKNEVSKVWKASYDLSTRHGVYGIMTKILEM